MVHVTYKLDRELDKIVVWVTEPEEKNIYTLNIQTRISIKRQVKGFVEDELGLVPTTLTLRH